jgi:ADP-ribosylglycohydrolase
MKVNKNTANSQCEQVINRALAALRSLFVADSLAMPVHWFYNPQDILNAFPNGITQLEAAPDHHPSSIMSLHSTAGGGRGTQKAIGTRREIVGEVILKGKRKYWGKPNQHYHQGMQAGENTLNAHCARVVMRAMLATGLHYQKEKFLDDYIAFMTSDVPLHPDTYAESYHRGFFANLESGKPKEQCGAVTHDTPSIGGLVTIAPIVLCERLRGTSLNEVRRLCREHLFLTHPDEELAEVCLTYVDLMNNLLFRKDEESAKDFIARAAQMNPGLDLPDLMAKTRSDRDIVGGRFTIACYISGSWPIVLYLAYKYHDHPERALLVNANAGGDNVHRGSVLGVLLGLTTGRTVDKLFQQLVNREAIDNEIMALLKSPTFPKDKGV